ncbi:MAG TPA: M48 family metallopeptidase [Campylobacterales bacterium]|nr:M48 family metallopeptidase [Campylobacterales bacterium]
MQIDAVLYDGRSSKEHQVTIEFTPDQRVTIASHGIDVGLAELKIGSRLGNTPRVLQFPQGIRCKSRQNDTIDEVLRQFDIDQSHAHRIESSWRLSLAAIFITAGFIFFMLTTGANYTANFIASILPQSTLDEVSRVTMEYLEDDYLYPSNLPHSQKELLQDYFDTLTEGEERYHLHFRASSIIGPNAFALPSGDIVLTDDLVKLSKDEKLRDILGVLAHEKGHVVKQHSLRMAIKTGIAGAIIGYMTGDISILATGVPTVLINSSYSREFEREADAHAVAELKEMNVSTLYMANLFETLAHEHGLEDNSTDMALLATHPLTHERIRYFKSFAE